MIREYVVKVTDTFLPGAFQRFESEWAPEQEIVRCEDCKYCGSEIMDGIKFAKCELEHNWMPQPEWFCADGERKEGRRVV